MDGSRGRCCLIQRGVEMKDEEEPRGGRGRSSGGHHIHAPPRPKSPSPITVKGVTNVKSQNGQAGSKGANAKDGSKKASLFQGSWEREEEMSVGSGIYDRLEAEGKIGGQYVYRPYPKAVKLKDGREVVAKSQREEIDLLADREIAQDPDVVATERNALAEQVSDKSRENEMLKMKIAELEAQVNTPKDKKPLTAKSILEN